MNFKVGDKIKYIEGSSVVCDVILSSREEYIVDGVTKGGIYLHGRLGLFGPSIFKLSQPRKKVMG